MSSQKNLRCSAESAEDAAAGFLLFRDHLPHEAAEITRLIAYLYAISSCLTDLDVLLTSGSGPSGRHAVQDDLNLLCTSLGYTLDDIGLIFRTVPDRSSAGAARDTFRRSWLWLCAHFNNEAQYSLPVRLAKYKMFLQELLDVVSESVSSSLVFLSLRLFPAYRPNSGTRRTVL